MYIGDLTNKVLAIEKVVGMIQTEIYKIKK